MEIRHSLSGHRQVVVERPDHSRIVAVRGGRSFVERPYQYRGREFARRSYYRNGRVYDQYYGRHLYRGVYVNYYTPAAYYRPAFYGWVYHPWVTPVPYGWGWAGSPWYGYYGPAYFAPYPTYPSASFWLTDYLVSASLAAAYEAQAAQAQQVALQQGAQVGAYGLAPDVKDLISAEVQRQIVLENSEAQYGAIDAASSSVERMLADGDPHIFVAGHELDVTTSTGLECTVSQGDTFQLAGRPPAGVTEVSLVVLASKGGVECHRSAVISVQLADLQEMQNYMRELIDQGLGELQSKQGRGTLPPLPASAAGEPIRATLASVAPPADANVGSEINQQLQTADAAENEALSQVPQSAPIAQPLPAPTISIGEGIDEVTVALGQPERIADLGEKKIYVYKDMKITFKNGSVSGVQ